jgi:hypothetical protein
MPNIAKKALSAAQRRFIDDLASLLTPSGMPQTAAQMYGYLLLGSAPVSLDRITQDLEISKSSASVAARMLERYGLARRHRERSSKRALYGASDTFAGRFSEQSALLGTLGSLIRERAPAVASGETAARLRALSNFYLSMGKAMDTLIRTLDLGARRAQPDAAPHSGAAAEPRAAQEF